MPQTKLSPPPAPDPPTAFAALRFSSLSAAWTPQSPEEAASYQGVGGGTGRCCESVGGGVGGQSGTLQISTWHGLPLWGWLVATAVRTARLITKLHLSQFVQFEVLINASFRIRREGQVLPGRRSFLTALFHLLRLLSFSAPVLIISFFFGGGVNLSPLRVSRS